MKKRRKKKDEEERGEKRVERGKEGTGRKEEERGKEKEATENKSRVPLSHSHPCLPLRIVFTNSMTQCLSHGEGLQHMELG